MRPTHDPSKPRSTRADRTAGLIGWHAVLRVLAVLALSFPGVALGGVTRIAVLDLRNPAGLQAQEIAFLSDLVREETNRWFSGDAYQIMTKENINEFLPPGTDLAACQGASCEVEFGKRIAVDVVVSGAISQLGDGLRASLSLHDVASGDSRANVTAGAASIADLEAQLRAAAQRLCKQSALGARDREGGSVDVNFLDPTRKDDSRRGASAPIGLSSANVDVYVEDQDGQTLAGAVVSIDDHVEGNAPRSIAVSSGAHRLLVEKDLYRPKSVTVDLKPGDARTVTFKLEPDFGLLTVDTNPSGATISLDGNTIGQTPLRPTRIKAGQYRLSVTLPSYVPLLRPINLKPGEKIRVDEDLEADFGSLHVTSTPTKASVTIDGERRGTTPLNLRGIPAGKYQVTVSSDPEAYASWTRTVNIEKGGASHSVRATLERRESETMITTNPPGATVFLDGERVGKTTWRGRLLGGSHQLELVLPRYMPLEKRLIVRPPQPVELRVDLRRGGSGRGGRFTAEDLGLKKIVPPPRPGLLEETRVQRTTRVNGGWLTLAIACGITQVAGIATMATAGEVFGDGSDQFLLGLFLALGPSVGSVHGWAGAFDGSDSKTVPDSTAIEMNKQSLLDWELAREQVRAHNDGVQRQVDRQNRLLERAR